MRRVRWGVLGTARIGLEKVIPGMQRGSLCEVVAIASRDPAAARAAADRLALPVAHGSYEALLADPAIEAVYIPLPNHLHVPWSVKALEAGKHVLCEKPIALTAAEAGSLVAAARRFPALKVMEAFMYRHHPQWRRAVEIVAAGGIGTLRTIQSFFSYYNIDPGNIRNRPDLGGGGLMDIGCYCISLSRLLFGAEPVRVCGIVEYDPAFGTDRLASGILDFGSGTATFTCSTQLAPYQRATIFGTAGSIEIEIPFNAPPDRPCRLRHEQGRQGQDIVLEPADQYTIQGDLFARAVIDDTPVPTPIEDAVANMRVIEALVKSGRCRPVDSVIRGAARSARHGHPSASKTEKTTMKARMQLVGVIVALSVSWAVAQEWPGYYGPRRDGTSTEKGILRTWPREGPKVLWTAPVGIGYGGPAVSGGKVYLLDRNDAVGDNLRSLDLSSGKELWNFAYAAPGKFDHPGSRTTPTVDGDYVYTCGPLGDLYCVSTTTHKPVWHRNIWKDFGGGQLPKWAITQNPLIYRNLVIVASQTSQANVVAFDARTGEVKWKSAPLLGDGGFLNRQIGWLMGLVGNAGYVSPSIVSVGGEDHLVVITAAMGFGRGASGGSVNGIDPLSGKLLWTYTNWQCAIPAPHAVDAGGGRLLVTGGYRAGAAMIKVQKKGDGSYGVTELFKTPDFGSHTQPPILYKDHFYAQYTINERSDGLVCMSMNGQVRWKTGEDPAFVRGGAILADGLLLATDGNTKLYVIEPDPSGFRPLASAQLLEPGENWAPLALADGKLLIRDQKRVKCVLVAQQRQ